MTALDQQELVARMMSLRAEGKTIRAIADELGVNRNWVHRRLKDAALRPQLAQDSHSFPGVFAGRRYEMESLRTALETALAGSGRVMLLAGEAGIGKSRIAAELATHASQRGAVTLKGNCYQGDGAPPYWPWIQVIRSYVQGADTRRLRASIGYGEAVIAEIVPEIRALVPDLKPPSPLPSEQARFRLCESITAFLIGASKRQPMVLVLEDLHWSDLSSLLVLEFLAREITSSRILVIATYRDTEVNWEHPLSQTLGELIRHSSYEHVPPLSRLSLAEVTQYITDSYELDPPPGLVEAVYEKTRGNPLFMSEVVGLLHHEGVLTPESYPDGAADWKIRIPTQVHQAIGRDLARFSQQCRQVLTSGAVIGQEFELDLLGHVVAGVDRGELLTLLEDALAGNVIKELPPAVGRYQFSHVLVQETLLDQLPKTGRAQLHARVGEGLEKIYGERDSAHASELAYHFGEAAQLIGPDKLVQYSLLAGEHALNVHAHEQALIHFQRALDARRISRASTEPANNQEAATILFGLARVQFASTDWDQISQGLENLRRAFDYSVEVGDVTSSVAIAAHSDVPWYLLKGATQILTRALSVVPPDSREEGQILHRYAYAVGMENGDYRASREALSRAQEIAQRFDDKELEIGILFSAGQLDVDELNYEPLLKRSSRLIELGRLYFHTQAKYQGHFLGVFASIATGDRMGAWHHLNEMLPGSESPRRSISGWEAVGYEYAEQVARLEGKWDEARRYIKSVLQRDSPRFVTLIESQVLLEAQVGEFAVAESFLQELENLAKTKRIPRAELYLAESIGLFSLITGDTTFLEAARELASEALTTYPGRVWTTHARVALALVAVLAGDADLAMEQYDVLKPLEGTMWAGIISMDRLLALLSGTMTQFEEAKNRFEEALSFCRKAGYRSELAWVSYEYAETLLGTGVHRDRRRALSLLGEALEISSELEMKPLIERAISVQEKANAPAVKVPERPFGLTAREFEVLKHMALGESNLDIASNLYLRIGTVTKYVENILGKSGATNRTEAAHRLFEWERELQSAPSLDIDRFLPDS